MEEKNRENKITRRDFMKKAGYSSAAVGVGMSLPNFLKPARAAGGTTFS